MPTPTPQELQEAKRRKAEERRMAEETELKMETEKRKRKREVLRAEKRRQHELWLKKRDDVLPKIERYVDLSGKMPKISVVASVLEGYYDEMDKLCKKAPADRVTELSLNKVNKVIGQVKNLLVGDEYIDSTEVFIPAGERPEHRDILLVLRELRQGITRTQEEFKMLREGYQDWREYQHLPKWSDDITDDEVEEALNPRPKDDPLSRYRSSNSYPNTNSRGR